MSGTASDGLENWLASSRSALVVVDMQVDFALDDGALGRAGVDLSAVPEALAAAERLAEAARSGGVPIVFVGLRTSPDTDSSAWAERSRRRGQGDGADLCREGSPGAAFVGPRPLFGERVVHKTRYSAFHETDLDIWLRAVGVDTLVVCGLTTECCVEATARDAFQRDYHVFVAPDACAAYGADIHLAALRSLDLNSAILVPSEAVIAVWLADAFPILDVLNATD